jgi:hypothetical protein
MVSSAGSEQTSAFHMAKPYSLLLYYKLKNIRLERRPGPPPSRSCHSYLISHESKPVCSSGKCRLDQREVAPNLEKSCRSWGMTKRSPLHVRAECPWCDSLSVSISHRLCCLRMPRGICCTSETTMPPTLYVERYHTSTLLCHSLHTVPLHFSPVRPPIIFSPGLGFHLHPVL